MRECAILRTTTGVTKGNPSMSGASRSSHAVRGAPSKWSKCWLGRTRMIRLSTPSESPTTSGTLVTTKARRMELCQADLRCLDAHAHLGNFAFEASPNVAIRHYTVGVCIGELSLGDDFDGLLPWGDIDNKPFLRCMHGFALCLWRVGRFEEAE